MKRVLITGATGFIGQQAIPILVEKGFEVHAISLNWHDYGENVKWHAANLMDSKLIKQIMEELRPSHLLHFAWYTVPPQYWNSTENFRWVESSIALLDNFIVCGGKRVVMAGTCAEYDWTYGYCSENVTPRRPSTPYGICKNSLQEMMRSYCGKEKVSGAWGRIFSLYGPHEHPSRLLSSVANSLLDGGQARCSHGNQIRDFMHVEDVASAFVTLLSSDVEGAVNIASGHPISLREIVNCVSNYIGAADRVLFGAIPTLDDDCPFLVADTRRLSKEVGWKPKYSLAEGIAQTANWWELERRKGGQ